MWDFALSMPTVWTGYDAFTNYAQIPSILSSSSLRHFPEQEIVHNACHRLKQVKKLRGKDNLHENFVSETETNSHREVMTAND